MQIALCPPPWQASVQNIFFLAQAHEVHFPRAQEHGIVFEKRLAKMEKGNSENEHEGISSTLLVPEICTFCRTIPTGVVRFLILVFEGRT